jgi:predicted alpha/beta-fold hydrolase
MPLGWPARPSFYHSTNTIPLQTRTGVLSLADFSKPVFTPFYFNPLLFNGHLQTFWTVAKWTDPYPIHYSRKHLINPNDGGHFAVDFVVDKEGPTSEGLPPRTRHMTLEESANLGSDDDKPMLVALHGLTGGSHELYLRSVLAPLVTPEMGFAACVVNARGCALSKITTGQLFNACFTEDVRETVKYLRKVYPNRPLFAVGFSLGANILTNVCSYFPLFPPREQDNTF